MIIALVVCVVVLWIMVGFALALGSITNYAAQPDKAPKPSLAETVTFTVLGPVLLAAYVTCIDPGIVRTLYTRRGYSDRRPI